MLRSLGLLFALAPCLHAQCELQKLIDNQPHDYDEFGVDVDIEGATAFVGAPGDDAPGNASGSVAVFERLSAWTQVDLLTASDGAPFDSFGDAVALSGDLAVIGAFGDDDAGSRSGSVYVFERIGGTWGQVAKLTAGDAEAGDYFGDSVAIAGEVIVVGAPLSEDAGLRTGSAYVFERINGVWTETAKLLASNLHAFHYFGGAVATDATTILIGATEANSTLSGPGSVYAFERSGASWTETRVLVPSDGSANDQFGQSISMSSSRALIGSYQHDDGAALAGSAYVFDNLALGWVETTKLVASDPQGFDAFGFDVALFGDRALVGAFRHDESVQGQPPIGDPPPPYAGVAYIFEFNGAAWTESAELVPSDSEHDDRFGYSVALSADVAMGGAPGEGGFGSGATYAFTLSGRSANYCVGAVNSTGVGSTVTLLGCPSVAANNLVLQANDLPPGTAGYFFYGGGQTQQPVGDGFLCVAAGGAGLFRLVPPVLASAQGLLEQPLDLPSLPLAGQVYVGSTWNFQAVYRDIPAGGAGFSFSDAVHILFGP